MKKIKDQILARMLDELEKAPVIFQPSDFWISLNRTHLYHLSKSGFKHFKRSISGKYFSWGILGIIYHQSGIVINELLKFNFAPITQSRFEKDKLFIEKKVRRFNSLTTHIYRIYVACLYDFVSKVDPLKLFDRIKEPKIGNPFLIRYKNKFISQDLCNSIQEFYTIFNHSKLAKNVKVAELGAGYGRLAFIFCSVMPNISYCIIDIPPALYISQRYLSAVFPNEKIFKFRSFNSYNEIKTEFEDAKIRFLMPHQMKLLPKKEFDIFITISSLHEMRKDQILNYIKEIGRLTKGYFYSKQWMRSHTKDNRNIKESEYPIPKKWTKVLWNSPHPIQRSFFDVLYKIR